MNPNKSVRYLSLLLLSLVVCSSSFGQAQNKFRLVYNVCTSVYEVHFVAQNTFTLTGGKLNVGPSSVGLILPLGAPDVTLNVTPVNGGLWADNAQRYAPSAAPASDFHYVTTTGGAITIASVVSGTDILLFTFTIGGPAQCFSGVRLWRNWAGSANIPCSGANLTMQWPDIVEEGTSTPDPCSGDLGGANFNNAFQSLINNNSYRGNLSNVNGTACTGFDYGDLTSAWGSAKAAIINPDCNGDGIPDGNGGAVWAGATVDADPSQYFSANSDLANGDDISGRATTDEDGLTPPAQTLNFGYTYNFVVTVNSNQTGKTVYYGLWIDWNNNGNFADDVDGNGNPSFYSGSGVTASPTPLPVAVKTPQYSAGVSVTNYKARLIVSDAPVTPGMFAATIANGEVEDYQAPSPILPVTFGKMSAQAKDCNVYLNFDILTQQNASHFEIEYSKDGGTSWNQLATIPASGTSNIAQSYSYIHTSPIGGINLYRIKNVDKDGRSMYSQTLNANSTCAGKGGIISYPNPVHATLTVLLPIATGKSQLRITDASGKLVQSITTRNSVNTINTQLLASGMYLLEVVNANNKVMYNTRFVKE